MRRAITTIAKLLGTGAFVACMALLLGLGVGPQTGRYRTMTVLTDSMRPDLPAGAVAVQTPMSVADVAVGDVITYRIPVDDRRIVTHRVVEVLESGPKPVVVTQGDAVSVPDPWVARLEGPVVWKTQVGVPYLGYGLEALREPLVRRLLVLGVPLLLAAVWLKDIWASPEPRRSTPRSPKPSGASLARTVAVVAPMVLLDAWAHRSTGTAGAS